MNEVAFGTNMRMKYLREKFSCNLIRDIPISITTLLLYSISPIWKIVLRHSLFHSYAAFLTIRIIIQLGVLEYCQDGLFLPQNSQSYR